jgi:hypothetical protein
MVACYVNDSLRVTSYRFDTITIIESNMFHNVTATGACEQETFNGKRLLNTMPHPPTAVTVIKSWTLMAQSK